MQHPLQDMCVATGPNFKMLLGHLRLFLVPPVHSWHLAATTFFTVHEGKLSSPGYLIKKALCYMW